MSLGEKIQRLRKENTLTQEALADKLGVSRQAISKWELDEALPDLNKLITISKLFQVSTDYLLDDELDQKTTITVNTVEKTSNMTEKSIKNTSLSLEYLGKWVKIYFNDKGYGGVYQAGVIDINDKYLLFIDEDNKLGILTIKNIHSIKLADIYKKKEHVPRFDIHEHAGSYNLLYNFLGKTCEIHLVCKSYFSAPGGFFGALIEDITIDSIIVLYNKKRSIINIDDLLIMMEK